MNIMALRRSLIGVAIWLALLAGCAGDYLSYRGGPEGFSTHPYHIVYPQSLTEEKLGQSIPGVMSLITFCPPVVTDPREMKGPPPMIHVRCHRLHEQETSKTFMERYYDDLAASYLEVEMRKVEADGDADEWTVVVQDAYLAARIIVLPEEGLAYDVTTDCMPEDLAQYEEMFRRARDSFELLPAPK